MHTSETIFYSKKVLLLNDADADDGFLSLNNRKPPPNQSRASKKDP